MKSLSLSQPHMIIMVGVPGSGKTFFAEKFAETFRAPYVSREKVAGLLGDNAAPTNDILRSQLDELLKTSHSIIIEGLADTRTERVELAKKARVNGYGTLLVWVQTDPDSAKGRALKAHKDRTGQPLETASYDRSVKRFTPPSAVEKPVVISGKHTYATQAKVVLKKLSEPRARISTHSVASTRSEPPTRRNITIR